MNPIKKIPFGKSGDRDAVLDSGGRIASAIFLLGSLALLDGFTHISGYLTGTAFTALGVDFLVAEIALVLTSLIAVFDSQKTSNGVPMAGTALLVSSIALSVSTGLQDWVTASAGRSLVTTAVTALLFYITIEGREIGGAIQNVTQ